MTIEPRRSQYLEAMGLSAWVSRYRLPNAAPTQACEWLEPESVPAQPPAQRLHALLDAAEPAPTSAREPSAGSLASARHGASQAGRARALLGAEGFAVEPDTDSVAGSTPTAEQEPASQASAAPPAEKTPAVSLRFTLQVAALDGRWLILLPGHRQPDTGALRLLGNLLQAARIVPGAAPAFQVFRWPMMEGQLVEAPLDEARDGLRAFVEGRKRHGWRPERLLVFGEDETLAPILELNNGHCRLLGIPGWQGPSLQELSQSATAKRELWPHLHGWRDAWHRTVGSEGGDDDPAA